MTKINQALLRWKPNEIHGLEWLNESKITKREVSRYLTSGLLDRVAPSSYIRKGDKPEWENVVTYLQKEKMVSLHVAGLSALDVLGRGHYAKLAAKQKILLTSYETKKIPDWIFKLDSDFSFEFKKSSLLKKEKYLTHYSGTNFDVKIASSELAILEYIESGSYEYGFEDLENYMELSRNIRPSHLQKILEECQSIKVKRIFLYMADKLNLSFFDDLNMKSIDLGSGKRVIVKDGVLDPKYLITVEKPEEENPF